MINPAGSRLTIDVLQRWASWYPDAPPVGFLLREAYPDRWLRVHSLPGSRRYPASGWDYAELLRRHNEVASHVLGANSRCGVILYAPCEPLALQKLTDLAMLGDGLQYLAELPSDVWDEDVGVFTGPMCMFGTAVQWNTGTFDGFICAVADEKVEGLIVELTEGRVYAPYDGGADLFFPTETERDLAQERFHEWLSTRADRL